MCRFSLLHFCPKWLLKNVWLYILINCLLVTPVPYLALKFSAHNLNKNYVIPDKSNIISLVLKYFLVINGLFIIGHYFYAGYLMASMIVGVFTIIWVTVILYQFAPKFIQESSPEEITGSADLVKEPSILKRVIRTSLLTIFGFIFLLVAPFIGYILISEKYGNITWLIAIIYFVVVISLFKILFFNRKN